MPSTPTSPTTPRNQRRVLSKPLDLETDPNTPIRRLQLHQKCLYERTLPGGAFISAHVNRLQHGYYQSKAIHEPTLDNVFLVSVHFVFHPYNPEKHRFKTAVIKVSLHGADPTEPPETHYRNPLVPMPRILKHAPELMYGSVSPENLQWNFSLSSSLGVSQAPVTASLNPSGSVKTSYKVYHMMSIQGSVRSIQSPLGPDYDIEDAMAVWTLEENILQRSGLPREFDFVLLVHKPNDIEKAYLTVDVDAEVDCWYGVYPKWYTNLGKYMPTQDYTLDFNTDIGQLFLPSDPTRGFNFADLPQPLEQYVQMPGTTYPTDNTAQPQSDDKKPGESKLVNGAHQLRALNAPPTSSPNQSPQSPEAQKAPKSPHTQQPQQSQSPQQQQNSTSPQRRSSQAYASNRHSWAPEAQTLNVRVLLEHSTPPPRSPASRRYSASPVNNLLNNLDGTRQHSIRRRRSQSRLKEYSAQQGTFSH